MRIFFIAVLIMIKVVSVHASANPSDYLIFNIQDSKALKLLITDEIKRNLEGKMLSCYVKEDRLALWSRVIGYNDAFFEISIALGTREVMSHNPQFISSQLFTSFQHVSLSGNDNELGAFFSVQNGQFSWFRERLERVPDISLIPSENEWKEPEEENYAFCMFEG